jgi:NAD(P)H-quinone oxidoreductase subunit 5
VSSRAVRAHRRTVPARRAPCRGARFDHDDAVRRMTSHELLSLLPLLLASLVPACLVVAAFLISRQRARFLTVASFVTTLAAGLAYLAVVLRPLLSWAGYDARTTRPGSVMHDVVQLDIVSSAMFLLVSTLALVVVRYSRTYLDGQRELDRYARSLLLTVASVTVLVTSNHLAVLVVAWFATDVGLHSLLTFYRTRRQAIIVAHKKFLLSRLADACFISFVVLVGPAVGSLRIDVVNAYAQANGELSPTLHLATVLLVFGVLLKSAQLPFHGWMTQVMEAPTPVSALLHAGVVNIGGFVMIRLAPLMAHASIAQGILLGFGLFTTIVAALGMTTRVSIKGVLAWSTIGQMGFMLVQCALGAWHMALMHLLAHSVYKAHTFLSAGSVVEQWRSSHLVHSPRASFWHLMAGAALVSFAIAPFYAASALPTGHLPSTIGPLAFVLGLSFAPMIGRALAAGKRAFMLASLFTLGASASYFGWHAVFEEIAPAISAGAPASRAKWSIVVAGLVLLFIAQSILQTRPNGRFANWLQPHLLSGLYIDDWFTRLTFRLWPPGLR